MSRFDAIIVGGGIMGSIKALWLARGGMRTALIERGAIARSASGVNAGTLTLHMTRADFIPYALEGWRLWATAATWLGHDFGVLTTPELCLTFTEAEAALLAEHLAPLTAVDGLKGFLINGHAGENFHLSPEKKRRVVEIARGRVGSKLIVAGVNQEKSGAAAKEAEAAITAGADVGVMASGDGHLLTCFVLGSEGSLVSLACIWPEPIHPA